MSFTAYETPTPDNPAEPAEDGEPAKNGPGQTV